MSSKNLVIIVGRLGVDPELRHTKNGTAVASLSVATSDRYKDKAGELVEKTEWHKIVAWSDLGERCWEYLSRGSQVCVEGKLQTRRWETDSGEQRYTTEIVARDVQFLGSKKDTQNNYTQNTVQQPTRQKLENSKNWGNSSNDDDHMPF